MPSSQGGQTPGSSRFIPKQATLSEKFEETDSELCVENNMLIYGNEWQKFSIPFCIHLLQITGKLTNHCPSLH